MLCRRGESRQDILSNRYMCRYAVIVMDCAWSYHRLFIITGMVDSHISRVSSRILSARVRLFLGVEASRHRNEVSSF